MGKIAKFEFQAKKGKAEELASFFKNIIPETRNFPSNTGVNAARSLEDEDKFIIITYWEHEANLGEYLSWRQEIGDFAILLSLLIQPPDIQSFETFEKM